MYYILRRINQISSILLLELFLLLSRLLHLFRFCLFFSIFLAFAIFVFEIFQHRRLNYNIYMLLLILILISQNFLPFSFISILSFLFIFQNEKDIVNNRFLMTLSSAFVLLLLLAIFTNQQPQQPVIGIYTQDAEDFLNAGSVSPFSTYIAASYVKNLQMAGAQVIPLFYHYSYSQLSDILGKINGVFFPGGQMPIHWSTQWTNKTAFIFQYAKTQNRYGNNYPIWATCLGYETLMYITSGQQDNTTVFTEVFGQDGKTCPLIVKNQDSRLMRTLNNPQYTDALTGQGIFFFHHRWSVLESTFFSNPSWTSFWSVISTSKTTYGAEFLSTVQAKSYPFFLTQYHPEKNSFEWRVPTSRTYNAISAEQKFINLFVNEARKNRNYFPVDELSRKLIYNYQPTLTPLDYAFVQVYIFDERYI